MWTTVVGTLRMLLFRTATSSMPLFASFFEVSWEMVECFTEIDGGFPAWFILAVPPKSGIAWMTRFETYL